MNKDLKSILISFSIVLLYFYATAGIAKLFWKDTKRHIFSTRVNFISTLMFIGTLFMIIVPYHLFGPSNVNGLYKFIIFFHLGYLILGCTVNSTVENHYE